jgi:hypothetical protein
VESARILLRVHACADRTRHNGERQLAPLTKNPGHWILHATRLGVIDSRIAFTPAIEITGQMNLLEDVDTEVHIRCS